MFKQLAKYTLLAVLWKKYRNLILATLLLFAYFWLIGKLHSDFIAYNDLKGTDQYLGVSFFAKWLLLAGGLAVYLGYVFLWSKRALFFRAPKPPSESQPTEVSSESGEDPFDALRDQRKLRNKSDLIIERYPRKGS